MAEQNSTPRKTCTLCRVEFAANSENFFKLKLGKYGLASRCKKCAVAVKADADREWRAKNHAGLVEYHREYREKNSAALSEKAKRKYEGARSEILEKRRVYYARTADARREYAAKRRADNPTILQEERKRYRKERFKVDVSFTLRHRVGVAVRAALSGRRKSRPTFDLLGYSVEDLRAHLVARFRDGMTEADLLSGRVHIDHIRPVSSFNITSDQCDDFKKCWALENLQPLWALDNLRKGAAHEPHGLEN